MQHFTNLEAIVNAQLPNKIERALTRSMQNMLKVHGDRYDPSADGMVVLIDEATTNDDAMNLFGHPLAEAPLEWVTYDRDTDTFLAVVLLNNQLGHVLIVENMPWISESFRANLIENLCGEGPS